MLKCILCKVSIVCIVLLLSLSSMAQQYHFVYIQADNQQPFYVKYGDKNYSSSAIGYIILPKLTDGAFTIQIGFPKNLYPEQTFNLSVANKDYGYALKNFNDKGWGLFNFQTTDIVMNVNAAAAGEQTAQQAATTDNSNPFGNMLANAINDSTLNRQRVVKTDTTKAAAEPPVAVLKDLMPVAANNEVAADSSLQTVAQQAYDTQAEIDSIIKTYSEKPDRSLQKKTKKDSGSAIVKASENVSKNGTDLIFLDNADKDTIHAFIPFADTTSVETKAAMADTAKGKVENPFFNNNKANTAVSQSDMTDANTANNGSAKPNVQINSNCEKMLSSYDAEKLKKKIISLDNQDAVLAAVKKTLRDKCVTTDQVKDLGNLFLSDENRYGFYSAVYPSVSDFFNFSQLQNTLIDSYYKDRFKALIQ